jgi:hypothetical protein
MNKIGYFLTLLFTIIVHIILRRFNEMQFEQNLLTENTRTGVVCVGGKCFMPDYFDKLVESKMVTFFERWV